MYDETNVNLRKLYKPRWIDKCIDSILEQTYDKYDIFLYLLGYTFNLLLHFNKCKKTEKLAKPDKFVIKFYFYKIEYINSYLFTIN